MQALSVSLSAAASHVLVGHDVQLTADVTGTADSSVTWSSTAGEVGAGGRFTAPDAPATVIVTATSVADPSRSDSASLTVFDSTAVTLTAVGPILDKENYVQGTLAIDPLDGGAPVFGPVEMRIKGRGNSTWTLPKKPYKVKLTEAAGLLGMPSDKEWALLANYWDRSLVRNSVGMELAARLGAAGGQLPWSPRSRFVELFLDGAYQGAYQLIETVKIAPERVNVSRLKRSDTTGEAVTGGYVLEIDQKCDPAQDVCFATSRLPQITVKEPGWDPQEPGDVVQAQLDYVKGYLQEAEDALFGAAFADPQTGYARYWEVGSLVDWYLVEELMKNVDADFYTSCYLSKERRGKLRMGPVWDFDLGAGNASYGDWASTSGWRVRQGTYYARLFQDPAFAARVRSRWDAVKAVHVETLLAFIDGLAADLEHSQAANFERWPVLGTRGQWDPFPWPSTHQGEVEDLKAWLEARIAWIDANL